MLQRPNSFYRLLLTCTKMCIRDRCVAFGETGVQFQDIFSRVQVVETMQEALDVAIANSKEQDIVLLSPACSSYDQFPNYEVRGTLFKEMVRKWLQA